MTTAPAIILCAPQLGENIGASFLSPPPTRGGRRAFMRQQESEAGGGIF